MIDNPVPRMLETRNILCCTTDKSYFKVYIVIFIDGTHLLVNQVMRSNDTRANIWTCLVAYIEI